jgi:hypothetical protein
MILARLLRKCGLGKDTAAGGAISEAANIHQTPS